MPNYDGFVLICIKEQYFNVQIKDTCIFQSSQDAAIVNYKFLVKYAVKYVCHIWIWPNRLRLSGL